MSYYPLTVRMLNWSIRSMAEKKRSKGCQQLPMNQRIICQYIQSIEEKRTEVKFIPLPAIDLTNSETIRSINGRYVTRGINYATACHLRNRSWRGTFVQRQKSGQRYKRCHTSAKDETNPEMICSMNSRKKRGISEDLINPETVRSVNGGKRMRG